MDLKYSATDIALMEGRLRQLEKETADLLKQRNLAYAELWSQAPKQRITTGIYKGMEVVIVGRIDDNLILFNVSDRAPLVMPANMVETVEPQNIV